MTTRPKNYDAVSMWLHWGMAVLLITGFFVGENTSHRFADGVGYGFHVSIGLAILLLTGLRIYWRLSHAAPAYPATMSGFEKMAASVVKLVFYVLLIVIPLSGLAAHASEFPGGGLVFGVLPLPFLPEWLFLGEAEDVHELTVHAWIPLLGLHVVAALWHHFAKRDDVLTRMMPKRH